MNSVDDVKSVAVIGSGVMGHGIAEVYALNGYPVWMMDVNDELLRKGMNYIKSELRTLIDNGFTTEEEAEKAVNRISTTTSLREAVEGREFVTEAVTEDLKLKRRVFSEMENYVSEDAILASNTSGLMITNIARGLKRPERVIGTHFSVPPHIVPGVEIIRGKKTSDTTFKIAYDLIKKIGKVPFVVKKEIDGFLLNRLQLALNREAFYLVEKGVATPEDVDICLNSVLGFRWATVGPFRQIDSAGIDTAARVWKYLLPTLANYRRTPKIIIDKVARGEYGMKTGKGIFEYPNIEEAYRKRDDGFLKTLKVMKTIWK
ncbi:MAG: 3-hydroxyacyl-CoA dehydrogenase family protein [Candidatus Bathyarchaeia archaeon]|nr:3-hydroxyacyl-CoA dehydrogenase family protein [Candidatus Bathyarchaeota archaeon]